MLARCRALQCLSRRCQPSTLQHRTRSVTLQAMAPKRKDGEAADKSPVKKAKKGSKTDPVTGDDGWTAHPPHLIYKAADVAPSSKIASFDLDGTLVVTKSGADYAATADDWKWYDAGVPKKLKELHDDGFKIVIFTNQGMIKGALTGKAAVKAKARIDQVIAAAGVPVSAYIATGQDANRKPGTGMWDFMCEHHAAGAAPDLAASYFVGDAAGRPGDFSDSDQKFAANVGVTFHSTQEFFGEGEQKNRELAQCFHRLAEMFKDETFKARAFKNVARALEAHPEKITSGKEAGKLKGVGKGSVGLIDEWLETGKMAALEEGPKDGGDGDGGKEEANEENTGKGSGKPKSAGLAFL